MKRMFRYGLREKIFILTFLSTLGLLLLLGYISQRIIIDQFSEQQTKYTSQLLGRTEALLNQFAKNIHGNLLVLSRDARLLSDREEDIQALLESYKLYWSPDVRNLYIIKPDHEIVGSSSFLWSIRGHSRAGELFHAANQTPGIFISEPYVSEVSDYTVTLATAIAHSEGNLVLALDVDLQSILSSYGVWDATTEKELLVLSAGNVPVSVQNRYVQYDVYSKTYSIHNLPLDRLLSSNSKEWNMSDDQGNGIIVTMQKNNRWNWKILSIVQTESYYRFLDDLKRYAFVIAFLGIALSAVISFYVTRYIAGPVALLVKQMGRVSAGNFHTRVLMNTTDEFGVLAQSFNTMVYKIRDLMDNLVQTETSKKHYELKVLQAQIQPHFLYNTLNSISYLAKRGQSDEVDRMIVSLINLMHFHLDKVDELVPLGEELEGVKHYAYLLGVRFPGRFTVEIEVDEALADFRIPKLTLQPLVENAIFHGILPAETAGTVVIVGMLRQGGQVVDIEVADDGIGMSREQAEALSVHSSSHSSTSSSRSYYHMGVRNVHERLRLYFGSEASLHINSTPGEGTAIRLTIPHYPYQKER
ncbi:histidine kinase [Paenibacillus sp. N4]|uniref:sensor histidine kinase n=1 Tax=Paenibacillus vietnamensis TaxID=2590547 RepID=UPI001CD0820F|nr:histidine kinase [Paenibacillus vietnamensis]MCA0754258.1 histidine kinase [Paenibacillus vietnamensis]